MRHPKVHPKIPRRGSPARGAPAPRPTLRPVRRRRAPVREIPARRLRPWRWLALAAGVGLVWMRAGGDPVEAGGPAVGSVQLAVFAEEDATTGTVEAPEPVLPATQTDAHAEVLACLAEGIAPERVELETWAERDTLRAWVAVHGAHDGTGTTLFLLPGYTKDTRSYDLSLDGLSLAGRLRMERVDGRWRIIGVQAARVP